jgi:hypothetical protein
MNLDRGAILEFDRVKDTMRKFREKLRALSDSSDMPTTDASAPERSRACATDFTFTVSL